MATVIAPERPDTADARDLIEKLEAHLVPLSPRESRHGYSVDKLIARIFTRVAIASLIAGVALWSSVMALPSRPAVELPARFVADRIFVDVATRGGDTLHLYTDTGGGLLLLREVAQRAGIEDSSSVALREIAADTTFPEPLGMPDRRVPIVQPPPGGGIPFEGMLGQAWFADRVWTFDYPARKLLLHEAAPPPEPGAHTAPLGFRTDSSGKRESSFPRIVAVVEGDTLQLLFDTGATGNLSASALAAIGDSAPAVRATSFITKEVLDRWRERHPDWRVIDNADQIVPGIRVIEVPRIDIAGFTVGPVWFTERPDANFHQYMSQFMDRRVDGALGGNALSFFRVTVDYPAATARFVFVRQ